MRPQLPRTYQAFLGRFERPSEVQRRAVPALLAGRDALICAPTASGKTEAYAAPAAEALLAGDRRPFAMLVVSPTRALANDLKRRLEGRMHEVGLSFGRYTSEHKERAGAQFPEVVVTTPEGLDSLLARRPKVLAGLRIAVLDEIHVLDGSPRGDQLRMLLRRLMRVVDQRPQLVAASATVGDPEGMAARYLDDAEVIAVDGGRAISFKAFPGAGVEALVDHLTTLARSGLRKVLVFCNAREEVEHVAAGVAGRTPFQDRVFAHHGSLSQTVRERTERQFLDAPAAVCVATMTLELGIDIGTVDYVLLSSPPHDVSSLMQRVGRGGRRKDKMRVGCACADAGQRLLVRAMLGCGARGELHEAPYAFRPGVLVQQAVVLAGARGYVDADTLRGSTPLALHDELGEGFATRVLESMFDTGLLEAPRGGRYVLTAAVEERYEQGRVHANFSDPASLSLVDRLTGEVIGHLQHDSARGAQIRLGGAGRRAVLRSEGRVLTDASGTGEAARYRSDTAPATSFGLGRAIAAALGAEVDQLLQVPAGASWCLVHGLGTTGGLLLAETISCGRGSGSVAEPTAYTLRLTRPLEPDELAREPEVERFFSRHDARLARFCGMGRYHAHLPGDIQRDSLRRVAAVEPVVAFLRRARLRTFAVGEEFEPAILDL